MSTNMLDLAREAFSNHNYLLSVEILGGCIREMRHANRDIYLLYGESLCHLGRIKEAFDVYSHLTNLFNYHLSIEQLKKLTYALVESIVKSLRRNSNVNSFKIDPLLCSMCQDMLVHPVTSICGHTFCRQCARDRNQCNLCGVKFTGQELEQDILVKKLVEKYWPNEIKAIEINDEAKGYLYNNSLDEALRCCNESLEKVPNNFNGLLLRSEVLHRLKHFQSSLADADNALKSRPTSYKAHFRRAEALALLGRSEEALITYCVSIYLDKTSQNIPRAIRQGITRILQCLLAPGNSHMISTTPYNVFSMRRRRHNRHLHRVQKTNKHRHLSTRNASHFGLSDCDEENISSGEDDLGFISSSQRRHMDVNINSHDIIPRPNNRIRMLIDRISQDLEKIRRMEHKPVTLNVSPTSIESSDFDCVLCCRTLWKPVVTPCGHTYCWICLDRSMDYSSQCPLCMSPLIEEFHRQTNLNRISSPTLISLSKRNVTYFIEEAMRRFIPGIYSKRQIQELEEEPSVPIFICTTAFPSVPCPLYVYEPRYRLMVRRAIENGEKRFGIVLPKNESHRYHDYGTMLDIRDCVMLGDGCSILSTVGKRRFRVLARSEKDGYDTAKIDYIQDEPIKEDRLETVRELNRSVLVRAIDWYQNLSESLKVEISKSFGQMPRLEENWEKSLDGPSWVWWITAILPLKQSLQTGMLATTSLEKRLQVINKTLIDYQAAQQKCLLCVSCDGLPSCQAVDCCQRGTTSTTTDVQQNSNQSSGYLL